MFDCVVCMLVCVLYSLITHTSQEPTFLTLTDLNDIEAFTYVVKSWAWQLKQGVDTQVMRPAMRFIVQDEPSPVLVTAADNGFVVSAQVGVEKGCRDGETQRGRLC